MASKEVKSPSDVMYKPACLSVKDCDLTEFFLTLDNGVKRDIRRPDGIIRQDWKH